MKGIRGSYQTSLLAIVAIAAVACGQTYKPGSEPAVSPDDFDVTPGPAGSAGTPKVKTDEYFVQKHGKKLDILFVLDNSASMTQELANVRASFADFIAAFAEKNMDYQIGLISTDARLDPKAWDGVTPWGPTGTIPNAFKDYPNAGPGKLLARQALLAKTGGKPYLHSKSQSKEDLIALFKANTELGLNGSGAETGLLSTLKFFAPDLQSGANAGFNRADSTLVTVLVTDEDESLDPDVTFDGDTFQPFLRDHEFFDGKFGWSGKDPTLYTKEGRMSTFITRAQAAKGNRPDRFQFYGMISPPEASCATVELERTRNVAFKDTGYFYDPANATAFPGRKGDGHVYSELAEQMYGARKSAHIKSVCTNFADHLKTIGASIADHVERSFDVSNRVESCMKVYIDDQRIAENGSEGWSFDPKKNRVSLHGLGLEGKESFTVKIKYVSLTEYPEFKVTRAPAAAATRTTWGCKN